MTSAPLEFRVDDLRGAEIAGLLREHLDAVHRDSPPGTVHAHDVERLRGPDVTFWSAWREGELVGCGALQELDSHHGEIKSMRTAASHLRTGVASALVAHIVDVARERGYRRISLETGAGAPFAPARELYARLGFVPCGPFGEYADDGHSVFMTRELAAAH